MIQLLEQAVRVRYRPQAIAMQQEEAEFVEKLAKTKITLEGFGLLTNTISETIFYIERNAHSRTQLHAMALRMQFTIHGRAIPV